MVSFLMSISITQVYLIMTIPIVLGIAGYCAYQLKVHGQILTIGGAIFIFPALVIGIKFFSLVYVQKLINTNNPEITVNLLNNTFTTKATGTKPYRLVCLSKESMNTCISKITEPLKAKAPKGN